MLAKVQEFPTAAADPVEKSITVTYNPNAGPSQPPFTFSTSDGPQSYLVIPEGSDATITVSLVLASPTTLPIGWADSPIHWIMPPDGPEPVSSGSQLILTVPATALTHYFLPLAFRFSITAGDVINIYSPTFLLTLPSDGTRNIILTYTSSTGSFSLDGVLDLESEKFLFNTLVSEDLEVVFNLSQSSDGTFDLDNPIVWAGGKPDWVLPLPPSAGEAGFTISANATPPPFGQSASFQLALQVQNGAGPLRVLSPDPIIINATIGDGGN
jgi:hypothetical protein